MPARTPASNRWPDVFPRLALLLFLVSVAMACGTAEPPKAGVSEAPPAAETAAPVSPAATIPTEVEATMTLPAQAETRSPRTDPPANGEVGQPRALPWGSGPDSFGDTPDKDGYYSSRRHFDLDSTDKVRRALVLLEKDADGTLHLRFSKADIDEMPTVEEVLPLVEHPPADTEALLSRGDPLLPNFTSTRQANDGEGVVSVESRLASPVPGYELRLKGDAQYEPLQLSAMDTSTGRVLWSETGVVDGGRIEFFALDPHLFSIFDAFDGVFVFDLRKGLLCRHDADTYRRGILRAWPLFVGDGKELQFVEGETIWRLRLPGCELREVGKFAVPPVRLPGVVDLPHAEASPDGSELLGTIGQSYAAVRSPQGISPVQLHYVWLRYDGQGYVEERRVFVRAHNAILGTESAVVESAREPFLVLNQFRSRTVNPATGALERLDSKAAISYFLIRNAHGNLFALRAPLNAGVGIALDNRRGLLHYGEQWFDLKVLATNLENDWLPPALKSADRLRAASGPRRGASRS